MRIDYDLERSSGDSQTFHSVDSRYRRKPAREFRDRPARLTERQAVFYRNLIRLAQTAGSTIPVDFSCRGLDIHLDYGCIKIAEHAGFIEPLTDGPDGVVDVIRLAWRTDGTSVIP